MSRRVATSTTSPTPTSTWRNRITGSGQEAPDQLLANPANWRVHPKAQQDALAGALNQVGWVQQVLVNRRSGFVGRDGVYNGPRNRVEGWGVVAGAAQPYMMREWDRVLSSVGRSWYQWAQSESSSPSSC